MLQMMLDPAGWRVGQWIQFTDEENPDTEYEGLIVSHNIVADNLNGLWTSVLTVKMQ